MPRDAAGLTMGDIAFSDAGAIDIAFDIGCAAPIERIELFDGTECIDAWHHPVPAPAPDDRIRVLAEGALYRGRGRILNWTIDLAADGTQITGATPINVFNRDRVPEIAGDGGAVRLKTVTTGNRSGLDVTLSDALTGRLKMSCELGEIDVDLATLTPEAMPELTGEGLGRRITLQRRPKQLTETRVRGSFRVGLSVGIERRLYLRVTQDNGHVAWTSPAYVEGAA